MMTMILKDRDGKKVMKKVRVVSSNLHFRVGFQATSQNGKQLACPVVSRKLMHDLFVSILLTTQGQP